MNDLPRYERLLNSFLLGRKRDKSNKTKEVTGNDGKRDKGRGRR